MDEVAKGREQDGKGNPSCRLRMWRTERLEAEREALSAEAITLRMTNSQLSRRCRQELLMVGSEGELSVRAQLDLSYRKDCKRGVEELNSKT